MALFEVVQDARRLKRKQKSEMTERIRKFSAIFLGQDLPELPDLRVILDVLSVNCARQLVQEIRPMHPEGIFDVTPDPQRRFRRSESEPEDCLQIQNKPAMPDLSIDPEETADIVIPLDHPVFRRNHSRSEFGD